MTVKPIFTRPPFICRIVCPPGFIAKSPCGCAPPCPPKKKRDLAGPICPLGCPPEWSLESDCTCVPPLEKRVPVAAICALACLDGLIFQPPCSCVAAPVCPVTDWLVPSALPVISVGWYCAGDQDDDLSRSLQRSWELRVSGGRVKRLWKPTFCVEREQGSNVFLLNAHYTSSSNEIYKSYFADGCFADVAPIFYLVLICLWTIIYHSALSISASLYNLTTINPPQSPSWLILAIHKTHKLSPPEGPYTRNQNNNDLRLNPFRIPTIFFHLA